MQRKGSDAGELSGIGFGQERVEKKGMRYGFREEVRCWLRTFSQEEMDLLLAMMRKILLTDFAGRPTRGTIALYEQARGRDAEISFVLSLKDGEAMIPSNGEEVSSVFLAQDAIEDLLAWLQSRKYDCELKAVESGMYYGDDEYAALTLNTTQGRFIMSSYVEFTVNTRLEFRKMNLAVLLAMAGIIRRLRVDDTVLKDSMKRVLKDCETWDCPMEFFSLVKLMFYKRRGYVSEVGYWEEWRKGALAEGKGKIYFE